MRFLIPVVSFAFATTVSGDSPAWWSEAHFSDPELTEPDIPPVLNANPPNNHGPANIGQAKHMARSALAALQAVNLALAASVETELVGPDKPIPDWDPPADQTARDKNHAPLLIGQLKAISAPFYEALHSSEPDWLEAQLVANQTKDLNDSASYFPWSSVTSDDQNKSPANIGQLKAVFSLRFEDLDTDQDGLADSWERQHFLNLRFDASADPDNDGLTNLQELALGGDPNAADADADQNGLPDDWELANAGQFSFYPPMLEAALLPGQDAIRSLRLRNDTDDAISCTIAVTGNSAPPYDHADSQTGGLTFVWEDISATDTRLDIVSENDDDSESISIPFPFELFGKSISRLQVCSNGYLTTEVTDEDQDYLYGESTLPDADASPDFIAPLAFDLNPAAGGEIFFKAFEDRLIVQYQDVERFGNPGETFTFQVVLFANGEIEFRYLNVNGSVADAKVGIQNSTGDQGLAISAGSSYPSSAMAIRFSYTSRFFELASDSATVPAHSTVTLNGTFHALALFPGARSAAIIVTLEGEESVPLQASARLKVLADTDSDGMPDEWEIQYGLEPSAVDANGDPDCDGYTNLEEFLNGTNPLTPDDTADADNDGMWDRWETLHGLDPNIDDSGANLDTDGLTHLMEFQAGTDPNEEDSDSDGMPDGWEVTNFLNPLLDDSWQDADGDGLTNLQELNQSTDPQTPNDPTDLDNDGMLDAWELVHGLDPAIDDSALDPDKDGLTNFQEFQLRTDPNKPDTDGDELPDGWEFQYLLDPKIGFGAQGASGDPDLDKLRNFDEFIHGTDPRKLDTDGDGTSDLDEIAQGSDPKDPSDGGQAPKDHVEDVEFEVGGDYASWRMEIQGKGPRDHRKLLVISPKPDEWKVQKHKLWRNNKYEVTLHHTGSKPDEEETWYCWEARVENQPDKQTFPDYQSERIEGVAGFFGIAGGHWVVDNRSGLFTDHNDRYAGEDGGGNVAEGLKSYLVPVGIDDNTFATGVDNVSVMSENRSLRGYQEQFWIMAPCGGQEYNGMRFRIPLDPAANLKIETNDATPDPVNTTQGTADPGPVVTWKGSGGSTLDHTPVWKIGQAEDPTGLAIRVKNMKYRTVTVAVFPVRDPQSGRAVVPMPAENVLQAKLDETFGVQLNAWISLDLRPQQDYDYDPDGDGYATTLDGLGLLQMHEQATFNAPAADIRVFVIDNVHLRAKQEYVTEDMDSEIYGSSHRPSSTVIANAGNPSEGVFSDQGIVDTIAHEIGHLMVGAGHPNDYNIEQRIGGYHGGPAPLPGTDETLPLRLMSGHDGRAPGARLMVKTEWDIAEIWLKELEPQN